MEVIAVMLVISVLAAVLISRGLNVNTYRVTGELKKVKAHLRYAQVLAMKTTSTYGIHFNTATQYWLIRDNVPALIPGEDGTSVNLTSLTISSGLPVTVTFDSFGNPGAANITIVTNGGSIVINANTGFIP